MRLGCLCSYAGYCVTNLGTSPQLTALMSPCTKRWAKRFLSSSHGRGQALINKLPLTYVKSGGGEDQV